MRKQHLHSSGGIATPTYCSWVSMLQRCYYKKNRSYKYYGAIGITVCPEWHDFRVFLQDMGDRPAGTTLGRINHKKGYYKSNCEWQTAKYQARHQSNNRSLFHNGEAKCVAEWAEVTGLKASTIIKRLDAGWSVERALSV